MRKWTMKDCGKPEYLDGCQLQFEVREDGDPIAYVGRREDATVMAAAKDLLAAAQLAYRVITKHRLASMDQNPHGVIDVLGSAVLKAGGKL